MSPAVEVRTRGHIVTDDVPDGHRAVPAAFNYDPDVDPGAVRLSFPGSADRHEWSLSRELLEEGIREPVTRGDVQVWPCGRAQLVIELHSPQGVTVAQFDSVPVVRFLHRTHATAAPAGR